jgi:hypothetical protein
MPPTQSPIEGLDIRRGCQRNNEKTVQSTLKILNDRSAHSLTLVLRRNHHVDDDCVKPTIVDGPAETEKLNVIKSESFKCTARKRSLNLIGAPLPPSDGLKKVRDVLPRDDRITSLDSHMHPLHYSNGFQRRSANLQPRCKHAGYQSLGKERITASL